MGLPSIKVAFETLSTTAVKRSQNGIVMLLFKDLEEQRNINSKQIQDNLLEENNQIDEANKVVKETQELENAEQEEVIGEFKSKTFEFTDFSKVEESDFTEKEYDYIRLTFKGNPYKVIVKTYKDISVALSECENIKFNYLSCPNIVDDDDVEKVKFWIIKKRDENKPVKAVLPNINADNEAVINFTTNGIKVGDKPYQTNEYCSRIAGILGGLPSNQSATYYVLDEVTEIQNHENPNDAIDNGELILINKGNKVRIARGVNSLTTTNPKKSEEFKKIKIVEAMDLIKEDIITVFEDEYIGKVSNNYDNKSLFVASVNAYLKGLVKEDILDEDSQNFVDVCSESNKLYLEEKGISTESLNDAQLKFVNTGSKVFLKGSVKILDAMEDLDLKIGL